MKDLTVGKEGKLILNFAIPMLIGNVLQQFQQIINGVIVGKFLGNTAIAAVGASFPIIFLLISLIIGIAMGLTIMVSQYFGAKDYENVRKCSDIMYIVLIIASFVLTFAGIFSSEYIFKLTHLPAAVLPEAVLYLNTNLYGLFFLFLYHGLSALLRGIGDSITPLYFLATATVINIILDLLFILVFHMGVEGTAYATIISQTIACVWGLIYINKKYPMVKLRLTNVTFDKILFIKGVKIGLPSGLQQAFVALGMVALGGIVNGFGTISLAAYSIASRIDSFALLPAMNFSQALSTFTGQNLGAGKSERVKTGYISTLKMNSYISIALSVIVMTFSHQLMRFFTNDEAVVEQGVNYLLIVGAFYLVFSTMFVNNGVMRGAGDTLVPMFITLFALWVIRIPVSWFLSKHFGEIGIWWGIPIAWFIGMLFSYIYYRTGKWKTKAVIKQKLE
ncbi:MAG: MATE family efflux transporter [Bacteroidota bacterium]